jgi:hypothetical protein
MAEQAAEKLSCGSFLSSAEHAAEKVCKQIPRRPEGLLGITK